MKATATKTPIQFARLPKDYAGLCRVYLPRPIHDEAEFDNAFEMGGALAGHKLTKDQEDYLDIVASMIEDYEKRTLPPRPKISGLDLLKFLMEQNGMNASDLARLLGVDRSLGSSIL